MRRDIHLNRCANFNLETKNMKYEGNVIPSKIQNSLIIESKDIEKVEMPKISRV
jgi:hypothetical protein